MLIYHPAAPIFIVTAQLFSDLSCSFAPFLQWLLNWCSWVQLLTHALSSQPLRCCCIDTPIFTKALAFRLSAYKTFDRIHRWFARLTFSSFLWKIQVNFCLLRGYCILIGNVLAIFQAIQCEYLFELSSHPSHFLNCGAGLLVALYILSSHWSACDLSLGSSPSRSWPYPGLAPALLSFRWVY